MKEEADAAANGRRKRERKIDPRSAQPYLNNVVLDVLKGETQVLNVMSAPSMQEPVNRIIMISKHSSASDKLRKWTYPRDEFGSREIGLGDIGTNYDGRTCTRTT